LPPEAHIARSLPHFPLTAAPTLQYTEFDRAANVVRFAKAANEETKFVLPGGRIW
jgi:hypothetical protein